MMGVQGGTCPHLENRPEGAWLRKTGVGVAVNGAGDRGQHLGERLKGSPGPCTPAPERRRGREASCGPGGLPP